MSDEKRCDECGRLDGFYHDAPDACSAWTDDDMNAAVCEFIAEHRGVVDIGAAYAYVRGRTAEARAEAERAMGRQS